MDKPRRDARHREQSRPRRFAERRRDSFAFSETAERGTGFSGGRHREESGRSTGRRARRRDEGGRKEADSSFSPLGRKRGTEPFFGRGDRVDLRRSERGKDGASVPSGAKRVEKRTRRSRFPEGYSRLAQAADGLPVSLPFSDAEEEMRFLGMIGLCKRAGGLVQGAGIVEDKLRSHRLRLLFMAEDASDNARKMMRAAVKKAGIPCFALADKRTLGSVLGRDQVVYVGIHDAHFAEGLWKKIEKLLNLPEAGASEKHEEKDEDGRI